MSLRLEVTKEAESQVRELLKSQAPGTAVRLFLESRSAGGCGCGESEGTSNAPSFGLAFDRPRGDDEVVRVDGVAFVVDPDAARAVEGARVDFVQDLRATGFTVTPPNQRGDAPPIGSGCGCGSGGGCC